MGESVICQACGQPVPPGTPHCPYCGYPAVVAEDSLQPVAPAPAPRLNLNPRLNVNPKSCGGCSVREQDCCIWVIILVIAGLLFMIAMPNIEYEKPKAKEAQTKQNVHSIQLALERYAVDHAGSYPAYLWGGSTILNIGSVNYYNPERRTGAAYWDRSVHLPYDMLWIAQETGDYTDADWTMIEQGIAAIGVTSPVEFQNAFSHGMIGDPLEAGGYMPHYPSNPFLVRNNTFSLAALKSGDARYACYGAEDGRAMWNLGLFGELPQLMLDADGTAEPRLDFPGSFYYHPRWADGATNAGHLEAAQAGNPGSWIPRDVVPAVAPPLNDAADVRSAMVAGYDLLAFGAPCYKGQDLDVSVAGQGTAHFFRTGYLTLGQERNPWITAGLFTLGDRGSAQVQDYDDRPFSDGIPDFFIIHLGSGMDKKADEINDANPGG